MTSPGFRQSFEDLLGKKIEPVEIDLEDFARFKTLYVDERGMIDDAKRAEYYVTYHWLDLGPEDTFIDVAAQDCPFAFFVRDHFGSQVFRQDLFYLKRGVNGTDIGGNAARIPLPSGSVSRMALHNSLEHFEGRSDIKFFLEAQRLLGPGGKLLIVPLFISEEYSTVRNDGWVDEHGVKHLWGKGARFARWYDLAHFEKRILSQAKKLEPHVFFVVNAGDVHPHVYPYFAIFEKVS